MHPEYIDLLDRQPGKIPADHFRMFISVIFCVFVHPVQSVALRLRADNGMLHISESGDLFDPKVCVSAAKPIPVKPL
jgi:hypothetical protein